MKTDLLPMPDGTQCVLMPPRSIKRADPMTIEDVRRIVAAHNRWVEKWNRHELDLSLPTSPESEEGTFVGGVPPRSALYWDDNTTGRCCVIRSEGWRSFQSGPFFGPWLRRPIDLDKVVWAGWLR